MFRSPNGVITPTVLRGALVLLLTLPVVACGDSPAEDPMVVLERRQITHCTNMVHWFALKNKSYNITESRASIAHKKRIIRVSFSRTIVDERGHEHTIRERLECEYPIFAATEDDTSKPQADTIRLTGTVLKPRDVNRFNLLGGLGGLGEDQ